MTPAASTDSRIDLLIQKTDFLQREIDNNKREAEIDLKRVKDDAEAEIQRVREKADADAKANAVKIAALEDERNKALRWGVLSLGGAVLGMAAFIWKHVPWGAS
ncbi:MAG: hypothetical protein JWQ01_4897 [Massilia sp.]|nr:hypothetical protein [Massilia sp.]